MKFARYTDQAIAKEVGAYIQAIRLKKNMSLEDVAKGSGVSRQTLSQLLNHGKGTVVNLIAVLRALKELERLSSLLEEVRPSPLQIVLMEGRKRQRATGSRKAWEKKDADVPIPKNLDW
jgi:putative transcriptional regulator